MSIINLIYNSPNWGGGWWRQPWANTLAYYQFDNNLNDSSWNNRNFTVKTWTVTYSTTSWGAKYAYFNNSTWTNYYEMSLNYTAPMTVSFFFNPQADYGTWTSTVHTIFEIWYNQGYCRWFNTLGISWDGISSVPFYAMQTNQWYLVTYTRNGSSWKMYINGTLNGSWTPNHTTGTRTVRVCINQVWNTNNSNFANNGYISELIMEDKERTAQEISDYFNQTKSLYWIS